MKRSMLVIMIFLFMGSLVGCEQAQQALDTVEKTKSLKEDVEKKANEVKGKVADLIPGNKKEGSGDKAKAGQERDSKENKKEKDD